MVSDIYSRFIMNRNKNPLPSDINNTMGGFIILVFSYNFLTISNLAGKCYIFSTFFCVSLKRIK